MYKYVLYVLLYFYFMYVDYVMSKYIALVGGEARAIEIVHYYREYFKNFKFYDCKRKIFVKVKDDSRPKDFVYMNMLIGDVKKLGNK